MADQIANKLKYSLFAQRVRNVLTPVKHRVPHIGSLPASFVNLVISLSNHKQEVVPLLFSRLLVN